jgi:glutamyl-tRNA reductase
LLELKKAKKELENGMPIEQALETLSHNLSKKILHHPTKALKNLEQNNEIAELIKTIYNLED